MKKYPKNFSAVIVLSTVSLPALAGGWVDDWVTSYTSSSPGFYKGSDRGYTSFGSMSARWPVQTEYPVAVSPPRINGGCGGIDTYWGGFSYISDPEWLVKKAEGMLKNAAFISFDLAVKNMCQPCSDAMATAEQLANFMNGLNINECSMAKKVVVERGPNDPALWQDITNEITQGRSLSAASGTAKNPSDYSSQRDKGGGKSPVNLSDALKDCPTEFKNIYAGGSVIDNISQNVGLNTYTEVLRGFTGDVVVTYDVTANLYTFQTFDACPQNESVELDAFVYGMVQKRQSSDFQCINDNGQSMLSLVKANLQNVVDSYSSSSQTLSPAAESMLNSVPIPVANSLKTAVMRGSGNIAVDILAEPIAFLLAGEAIQDLFERADAMVRYGVQAASIKGVASGGDPHNCKPDLVQPASHFVQTLRQRLWEMRKHAKQQVIVKLQEMQVSAAVARDEESKYQETQKVTRKSLMVGK